MNVVQTELNRIRAALRKTPIGPRFAELYAAQQALCWAAEPEAVSSPLDMIERRAVEVTDDTLEGSGGCPSASHPASYG
jgi:hypothetical protein